MPRKVRRAQVGACEGSLPPPPATPFNRPGVPAGTPPRHGPSAHPNSTKPANRCGARIAGATSSLPLTSFLTSSYDLRNWKAIGKARRRVPVRSRIPRGTVANRHRAPATLNPHRRPKTGRYATRHGGKGPTAHSAPARQRNCGRHHSHGKARSTRATPQTAATPPAAPRTAIHMPHERRRRTTPQGRRPARGSTNGTRFCWRHHAFMDTAPCPAGISSPQPSGTRETDYVQGVGDPKNLCSRRNRRLR